MSRIRWYGPTLMLLATLVLAMLLGPRIVQRIARSYESARIAQVRQELVENPTLTTLSDAFKDVATVVRPSVTSITLHARDQHAGGALRHFSNGSGWVYRHYPDFDNDPDTYDDYIITNHHVVSDVLLGRAEQVIARFDDGGEYRATIIGTDPRTDVAVLKINREDLMPAALATTPAQQGEIVFAVGSPFQFEFSMSQGIVSATGRRIHAPAINSYENFIQTDAAINPGNSGGPLTNVRGEVIGMNTAIAIDGDPAREFSGLGFAIPIDQIVNVVDQIIEKGKVERGYIGVFISDIDFATRREMGFEGKGVLSQPEPGGPAEQAGVQLGDIITHIDGKPVATAEELRIAVSSNAPGTKIPVRIWRRGRAKTLHVQLTEHPVETGSSVAPLDLDNPFERSEENLATLAGISRFRSFSPGIARQSGRAYTPGVLVTLIESGSAADDAGLVRMSVITAVDGRPVHDLASFAEAIEAADAEGFTLTTKRWDPSGEGQYEEEQIELSTQ